MKRWLVLSALSVLALGCVGEGVPLVVSPSHPASPEAAEVAPPPAPAILQPDSQDGWRRAPTSAGEDRSGTRPSGGTGNEDSVMYTCPMHPDVLQTQPGPCPVCGMPMVRAKESQ
jgi:hypothetical protein